MLLRQVTLKTDAKEIIYWCHTISKALPATKGPPPQREEKTGRKAQSESGIHFIPGSTVKQFILDDIILTASITSNLHL